MNNQKIFLEAYVCGMILGVALGFFLGRYTSPVEQPKVKKCTDDCVTLKIENVCSLSNGIEVRGITFSKCIKLYCKTYIGEDESIIKNCKDYK